MVSSLKFSLFHDKEKGIESIKPIAEIGFERLIEIYESDFVKKKTKVIRQETDGEKKKELKKQLPFITPYSVFDGLRRQIHQSHFNENLLAMDIDDLEPDQVQWVKTTLKQFGGTILCSVSPRGKGVKALVLIENTIPTDNSYEFLKINLNHIAEGLGLKEFTDKIDFADKIDLHQFVPTQIWFISYDEDLYLNRTPLTSRLNLISVIELPHKPKESEFLIKPKTYHAENWRVIAYIQKALTYLEEFFAGCCEGNRHRNIIRVQSIANIIHYAPSLEEEAKERLLNACIRMYKTESEAKSSNVYKSFETAWNGATPQRNSTIEEIIHRGF